MRRITIILMSFLFSYSTSAQDFVRIGEYDDPNVFSFDSYPNGYPTTNNSPYVYSQNIYLASEVGRSGNITAISWYRGDDNFNFEQTDNVKIYIGTTTKTEFDDTSDWIPFSELTQVYSGSGLNGWTPNNWRVVFFQTPFEYNGIDNLVIAVDDNDHRVTNTGEGTLHTPTSDYRGIIKHAFWPSNIDPQNPGIADNIHQKYANVRLYMDIPEETCQDANLLEVGVEFNDFVVTGQSTGINDSGAMPLPTCGNYNGGDGWYKVQMPSNGELIIETKGNIGDTAISVYSGNCNNLVEIACDDDSGDNQFSRIDINDMDLIGEELFIRVWQPNNTVGGVNFDIAAWHPNFTTTQGASLNFDGSNDIVTVNEGIDLANTSFSIEFWAKRERTGQEYVLSQGTSSVGQGLFVGFGGGNNVFYGFWGSDYSSDGAITDNNWHHYTVTYDVDADIKTIYIDGVASGTLENGGAYTGSANLVIGKSFFSDNQFKGNLDELRFWDYVLDASDIAAKMGCELQGNEPGLLAHYKFNQGENGFDNSEVTTLIDNSNNDKDGTLQQFALSGTSSNWSSDAGVTIGNLCPIINDLCDNSIPIAVGGAFEQFAVNNQFNIGATDSGIQTPSCGIMGARDAWYNVVVPEDGTVTIETKGDNSDTLMAVYTGDCSGTLTEIACDDNSGDGNYSKIDFSNLTAGQTLLVRVWGNNDEDVNFNIAAYNASLIVAGSSLNFDGIDDIVEVSGGINLANKSFSIEFWAKRAGTGQEYIISQGTNSANQGLFIGFGGTDKVFCGIWGSDFSSSSTITDNEWHHYVFTLNTGTNNNTKTIYIDGVVEATFNGQPYAGSGNFFMGKSFFSNNHFKGNLDELRVWDRALLASEVASREKCQLLGTEEGLLAYYNFNQGFGGISNPAETTLIDNSANDKNGTLTNFALSGEVSNWDEESDIISGTNCSVLVNPTVFLQGATLNSINQGTMRDDLRVAGLIPTTSPYADALTCDPIRFENLGGSDSIVDWVWVELRDATDNTVIMGGKSALLQRNGEVVNAEDGETGVPILAGGQKDYYVVIKHRNHLGILSSNTVSLKIGRATYLDFSDADNQITFGANAQTSFGMPSGKVGMWSGDANANNQVRYLGPGNDTNFLKDKVLDPINGNPSNSNFYPYNGYDNADIDMNGQVRYLGPGNDTNILKDIILSHPSNTTNSNFFPFNTNVPSGN